MTKTINTEVTHNPTAVDSQKLSRRMRITKSNLFNYAKRFEKKAHSQSIAINLLSLLTILVGVALLAFSDDIPKTALQLLGVFSIGVSLISIFLSLDRSVQDLSQKSSDAHFCARQVSQIYRKIEANQITLEEASESYEKTLSAHDVTHDRCDYLKTIYENNSNRRERGIKANYFNGQILPWLSQYLPIIISLSGIILVLLICAAILYSNQILNGLNFSNQYNIKKDGEKIIKTNVNYY